ncbi:MAG: response regulator [Spirochaetes bacterium]|nr:response regulator [Spirochaetota bacterium]
MKILVVDDSPPFQVAIEAMLKEAGYTDLVIMESAKMAINYLNQEIHRKGGSLVDLILMDIQLPDMNGIEAVTIIKSHEDLKEIPIVMVSVLDEGENIEKAFSVGAIDYIGKPVNKLELKARVRSILKLKEEMDKRVAREEELKKTVRDLEDAMKKIKHLSGLLPICSHCKKVRDDKGYWQQVEIYLKNHINASFSHSVCPDCLKKLYPEIADSILNE